VVAEFFYGFGNNYAGANLGNLDVFLASLQKYAPEARVIVLVKKAVGLRRSIGSMVRSHLVRHHAGRTTAAVQLLFLVDCLETFLLAPHRAMRGLMETVTYVKLLGSKRLIRR